MSSEREAVIVGIGRTEYSRNSGRTTLGMAAAACRDAVDDAGMDVKDVDGLACFAAGDSAGTAQVGYALGLDGTTFNLDVTGGGNVVSITMAQAMMSVTAGAADSVLVYRSLNSRSGKRFGTYEGHVEVEGAAQFNGPHGYMAPGQWFAMWTRTHMEKYGTTYEDLGAIAVLQRQHAAANPHAILRKPLTIDDYLAGRWINDPFRIYDCALEADGAIALLVTTRERARDLQHHPVRLLGHASYMGAGGFTDAWDDMTCMYSAFVGPQLWERTGLKPSDMDTALLYDCFTYTSLATTEDFGFCEKGDTGNFYRDGRATYGGEVVVNPHGGLLSEGYIHGMNHQYEAVAQLRHDAGERQVPDAELAFVSAGAAAYGGASVYARD